MKLKITTLSLMVAVVLFTGCASIVSKNTYPLIIRSTPTEATISVTDIKGKEVYVGTTPTTVSLKSGAGYFRKAGYSVKFSMDGYDDKVVSVHFGLDGWYFGNLVFGGLIGLLIIDPATGSMYKLKTEFLNESLSQSSADSRSGKLRIYSKNEIPSDWQEHLTLLSE